MTQGGPRQAIGQTKTLSTFVQCVQILEEQLGLAEYRCRGRNHEAAGASLVCPPPQPCRAHTSCRQKGHRVGAMPAPWGHSPFKRLSNVPPGGVASSCHRGPFRPLAGGCPRQWPPGPLPAPAAFAPSFLPKDSQVSFAFILPTTFEGGPWSSTLQAWRADVTRPGVTHGEHRKS